MNLYLLTQDDARGWDTFDSAVVAAESAEDAKTIHPRMSPLNPSPWESDPSYPYRDWAGAPSLVSATLIGIANPGTERSVIIASFNAG